MDRCVRQHDPDHRVAGGDRRSEWALRSSLQQHDRCAGMSQRLGLVLGDVRQLSGCLDVSHHDGHRFVWALLLAPQPGDGGGIRRVACQVEPTQPLHGDDAPVSETGNGPLDERSVVVGGSSDFVGLFAEPQSRTTIETTDGLCVMAPIIGIGILGQARVAHGETRHGGGRSIVGQRSDDGEPGPTVGACDERMPETPILRVEHLLHTAVAHGGVRRDRHRRGTTMTARHDLESTGTALHRCVDSSTDVDHRERWRVGMESKGEGLERSR